MSYYTTEDRKNARLERERRGVHGDFTDIRGRIHCGTCSGFLSYHGASCTYCRNNPDKVREITGSDSWGWNGQQANHYSCGAVGCYGNCQWCDNTCEEDYSLTPEEARILAIVLSLFAAVFIAIVIANSIMDYNDKQAKAANANEHKVRTEAKSIIKDTSLAVVKSRGTEVLSPDDSRTIIKGLDYISGDCERRQVNIMVCNNRGIVTVSYVHS